MTTTKNGTQFGKIAGMNSWFTTPLGQSLVNGEREKCIQLVPSGYYARSLQIGFPWVNYLEGLEVSSRFIVDCQRPPPLEGVPYGSAQANKSEAEACYFAVSDSAALPFPEKSQDLIVLPHTLDFCPDPHEVLRQSTQILVPDGCIVIIGFNLISFYGAIKVFKNSRKSLPWSGHYYPVGRVQDWLALLGFDLVGAGMMSYQPPVQSEKWRSRLEFFESAGDRWWPGLGGVYIIVGRKREMTVTPLPKSARTWHTLIPGMAQSASQRAAKIGLKLVPKN
jgi:SAM-dependent methyltransferase